MLLMSVKFSLLTRLRALLMALGELLCQLGWQAPAHLGSLGRSGAQLARAPDTI
jgi:hypothetical protein